MKWFKIWWPGLWPLFSICYQFARFQFWTQSIICLPSLVCWSTRRGSRQNAFAKQPPQDKTWPRDPQNAAPRHAAVGAKPHQGQNFAPSCKSWVLKNTDLQGNLCFKAFHGKYLPKRHVCPLVLWVPQSRKYGNHSDIPEFFIVCCLNFMLWSGF